MGRAQLLSAALLELLSACGYRDSAPGDCSGVRDARLFIFGSDLDHDGLLSLEEYQSSVKRHSPDNLTDQVISETFRVYDLDADGYIAGEEIEKLARKAYFDAQDA